MKVISLLILSFFIVGCTTTNKNLSSPNIGNENYMEANSIFKNDENFKAINKDKVVK